MAAELMAELVFVVSLAPDGIEKDDADSERWYAPGE